MLTNAETAARVLTEVAGFFRSLGDNNPRAWHEMERNASLCLLLADRLAQDPKAPVELDPDHGRDLSSFMRQLPDLPTGEVDIEKFFTGPLRTLEELKEREGGEKMTAKIEATNRLLDPGFDKTKHASAVEPGRNSSQSEATQALDRRLAERIASRIEPELLSTLPPPFAAEWREIGAAESGTILKRLALKLAQRGHDAPWPLAHKALALRCTPLPFYGNALFVDAVARHRTGETGHASFVILDDGPRILDNCSAQIHDLNEDVPLKLSGANDAVLYLRFFCWIVSGEDGPFALAENRERLEAILSQKDFKTADDQLQLEAHEISDGRPGWEIRSLVEYGAAVFAATFEVMPDGAVEMTEDEPVAPLESGTRAWRLTSQMRYVEEG